MLWVPVISITIIEEMRDHGIKGWIKGGKRPMRILKRWFPNEIARELISELDKLTPLFENETVPTPLHSVRNIFPGIKNRVKEYFIEHQDEFLQISKQVGFNPRGQCLGLIASITWRDLSSGPDHVGPGRLYPIGEAKWFIWDIASREAVRIGLLTDEKYRKAGQGLYEQIRMMG